METEIAPLQMCVHVRMGGLVASAMAQYASEYYQTVQIHAVETEIALLQMCVHVRMVGLVASAMSQYVMG